jgi:hypothetical protein
MIVRFFKSGTSDGESPVGYLLRMRDHTGQLRPEVPELLLGSPQLTVQVINAIQRKHKYVSGCLAFRPEEQPTREQLLHIVAEFKRTAAAGLTDDQFNSLFVIHHEQVNRNGQHGFHVHFVLPMTILSGQTRDGRDLTGKRWNAHPPGEQNLEIWALFTQLINQRMGWKPVVADPLRVGIHSVWRKGAHPERAQRKSELLQLEIRRALHERRIQSRDDLVRYLNDDLGLTVTRTTSHSVSVKFPGSRRAIRLKGPLFESGTDFQTLCATASANPRTDQRSVPDTLQIQHRLNELLTLRAQNLLGMRRNTPTHPRRKRKENVYGTTHRKHPSGDPGRHTSIGWRHALPVTTSGLERNLFPAGPEQWRHANGGNDPASHGQPQEAAKPVQHAVHEGGVPTGATGKRRSGGPISTSGPADFDQKIWALAVALNECEPGSADAMAILNELSVLQGERERQPLRTKPKFHG